MSKIAPNGRLLLRKPRLYRSCSAEEEEEGYLSIFFRKSVEKIKVALTL
jgi:hypothetical protein